MQARLHAFDVIAAERIGGHHRTIFGVDADARDADPGAGAVATSRVHTARDEADVGEEVLADQHGCDRDVRGAVRDLVERLGLVRGEAVLAARDDFGVVGELDGRARGERADVENQKLAVGGDGGELAQRAARGHRAAEAQFGG